MCRQYDTNDAASASTSLARDLTNSLARVLIVAFMNMERDYRAAPSTSESNKLGGTRSSIQKKLQRYNHDVVIIFDLPGLQLNMKTEHPQQHEVPKSSGNLYMTQEWFSWSSAWLINQIDS